MENNKGFFDTILSILGVLSLFAIIYHVYKTLDSKTETNVISKNGLKAIQDPKNANKLREAVDDYHEKGEWNERKLEAIL
ncbi:hypothetical protein [Seonamhaeicola maritimus]|uniref:hypothetical protein n=1 Tax=Seonamhaeicola maritimus TaxID=2591822 RepID=UPI002494CE24|nr:hypothetical protein [Seonamhaeicola maritimus]